MQTINIYFLVKSGRIEELYVKSGDEVETGVNILKIAGGCTHPTVMKVNLKKRAWVY